MRHTFQAEQWLPYPVELVFTFFSNPENLPRLMPPWQDARIEEAHIIPPPTLAIQHITAPAAGAGAGSRITLSFRPIPYSPLRLSWQAEITEFVWNNHFCDQQLRGPFAYWKHCHTLRAESRSSIAGTLLSDAVTYELPAGKLGDIANNIFIARQLRNTFAYRHKRTQELIATNS
jgi:ligand-binding SRPBCC domain-containing protein